MAVAGISSWISGAIDHVKNAKKWVGKAVGVGLEVAGVVANASKDIAMETFKDWDEFKRKTKKIIEGAQVVVDGVVYVAVEVADGLVKYIVKDKRALGLGVVLIGGNNCDVHTLQDKIDAMQMTSEAMFWLQASEFSYKPQVPCSHITTAYQDVAKFIASCSGTSDQIFVDTANLIEETVKVIENFCGDKKMQRSLDTCGCRCNCTNKSERMLMNLGLVDDSEVTGKRSPHEQPLIGNICSATRTIDACESDCGPHERKLEDVIGEKLSSFCSRHATWDPSQLPARAGVGPVGADVAPAAGPVAQDIAPANVAAGADSVVEPAQEPPPASSSPAGADANTTAAAKETTTTAGTASLETAFGYLSLIVSMMI